ncbi:MAG: multiprotein bridging factor aMBF1 [Halobacteriota archaeon]
MHCELCGKEISGQPRHVVIEGAELDTCSFCGSLGTEIRRPYASGGHKTKLAARARTRYADIYRQMHGELDPDFDQVVREARERAQLTQEQLAGKIMEKALVIKKVERKELTPDDKLRKKLEKALDIHLLVDVSADQTRRGKHSENLTLGDIAVVKRKG